MIPQYVVLSFQANDRRVLTRVFTRMNDQAVLVINAIRIRHRQFYQVLTMFDVVRVTHLRRLQRRRISSITNALQVTREIRRQEILTRASRHDHLNRNGVLQFLVGVNVHHHLSACNVIRRIRMIRVRYRSFLLNVMSLRLSNSSPLCQFLRRSLRNTQYLFKVRLLNGLLNSNESASNVNLSRRSALRSNAARHARISTQVLMRSFVLHNGRYLCWVE